MELSPPPASRRRSKASVRHAAASIVRRLDWATWPLVYWAGAAPEATGPSPFTDAVTLDVRAVIAAKLVGKPAGAFAVRLERPAPRRCNTLDELVRVSTPVVAELIKLDESLIGRSLGRLLQSRRFPAAVAAIVGDAAAWRGRIEAAAG